MEQQDINEEKQDGHKTSEMKNAGKEIPDKEDAVSDRKSPNKEAHETRQSEVDDNSTNSSSNIIKQRDKNELNKSFGKIRLTQNNQNFRETAKYRDFESYANQHHHSIGEGVFMTEEIKDLPPRFRIKVMNALENALALHNVKIDRNPLEYFTSYENDSKELEKNQDKLVYLPPNVLEDKKKSSECKSDFISPLNTNFIEKETSDLHNHSDFDLPSNIFERPSCSGDKSGSAVPSQNFRNKRGFHSKPPIPRTYSDNGAFTKQKCRGKSGYQLNVQNPQSKKLYPHQTDTYSETSSLPPKTSKNYSKFPSSTSVVKNVPESHSSNFPHVNAKTSRNHHHSNDNDADLSNPVTYYQKLCNSEYPYPDVEISYDNRHGELDNKNRGNSNACNGNFSHANKSSLNATNRNSENFIKISVDDLFRKSNATVDENTVKDSGLTNSSVCEDSSSKSNKISNSNGRFSSSNSRVEGNATLHNEKTFPNSKMSYQHSGKNKSFNKNEKKIKSQDSVSSYGNKVYEDSPKHSFSNSELSNRKNENIQLMTEVKSKKKHLQSETFSEKKSTAKFSKYNPESQITHQNKPNSPSYSGKDNFSNSKGISSKKIFSDISTNFNDNKYSKTGYAKNYANKEKISPDSCKVYTYPETEKSNKIHQSLSNVSVQNTVRNQRDSHSSISSSYSSNSVPERNGVPSNTQQSSRGASFSVNNIHDSFEPFSHPKPMYKQLNKESDFSKKSNYRNKDKYSDSSSVLSDKSSRTCDFSDTYDDYNKNERNLSNETSSQRSIKHFRKSTVKNFDKKGLKKLSQNSKMPVRERVMSEKNQSLSNKTDAIMSKSNQNGNYHNFKSIQNEKQNDNNSRLCTARGFFVKVEVSENATNLEYWMKYFNDIFQFPIEFERCCRFSDILILEFERKKDADKALDILYDQKKKLKNSSSNFNLISTLLNRVTKPCNCSKKVISDCVASIEKHFESSLCFLDSKIEEARPSTSTLKKYRSKETHAAESKILATFDESILNFTDFKEKTILALECAENLRTVQQLRYSFIRECNFFKRCLPIYSKREQILNLARFHSVSIIVAETGSGKSTQLVEYLLHSPVSKNGLIICTQPRKLAAISIAQFVSGQIGSAVGKTVGYDVGIEKKSHDKETRIIYMTDYCLLKYFLRNRDLKGVSCIIIDEAHERSLYTDLILGLLKKCLEVRRDLSVIITSATINPAIFVDYFKMPNKCVIEVPGRTYPVDVVWHAKNVDIGWDYLDACVRQAYDIHVSKEDGDILVFLTSPSESEEAIYSIKKLFRKQDPKPQLLSLHGKTDIQEQMMIFQKTSKCSRKIIFATNVAETAVTIPGIKYVVDSGMTKELMFDPQKNKSYLTVTFTTKSAAEQRKGRAGRTQSGICYRMYSKKNYADNMADNAVPEILKSNLQKALLKIFEFGIDPENFDFIEAPPARTISNSVESLEYLGAVKDKKLTDLGKKLVKLPLEPQLSKLVLQGIGAKIGMESIIIAALISESGKLFVRNFENKVKADEKKKKFCREGGDLCTYLEIYKRWKEVDINDRYDWCLENFISFKALSAAAKTVKEILITLRTELMLHVSSGYNNEDFKKQYEKIIFESFSENLCVLSGHPKLGYLSPYLSESFFIHPSSTLSYLGNDLPEFLVYSTLMETSRNFLFDVTPISEAALKSAYQTNKFRLPLHTLRCLQIPPKVIGPCGESVLIRYILGKGGSKIKDLEKNLAYLTSVKNLYVNVDVQKGSITVYLPFRLHEKAENHIQEIINKGLAELLNEEDVIKLSGISMHFALGAGGVINDIIMPGEFRELVIKRVKPEKSSELKNILQKYGPLQSFSQVTNKQELQLCATFKTVSAAKKAFYDLKLEKTYDVSSKLFLPNVSNKTLPLQMLLISWCCNPCTGYGSVKLFSKDDLIVASGTLTCNSFFVGNNLIIFEVARDDECTLTMKNLPECIEESIIREKLRESIPDIKIKSIRICRKHVKITDATVEAAKNKLSKLLSLYSSNSKFIIDLKDPKVEARWKAVVYFDNAAIAENIFMKLKDSTCIDSYPLSVRLMFKCQLNCQRCVFDMVSLQIINFLKERRKDGTCEEFSIKVLSDTSFDIQLEFSSVNLSELGKTRLFLRKLLEGEHLDFIANLKSHFLFADCTTQEIKKIEKSTSTLIKINKIKKVISIYGLPENCRKAKGDIYQLVIKPDSSLTRTFNLKDSCIPRGFLKHLYSKFGYDLLGLASDFKLSVASIDRFGSTLTLKGSRENINKTEKALEKICKELFKSKGQRQTISEDEEVCPICFDPVTYDFQRLEHCGHAFCWQCLLLQLQSKAMPLVCVKQHCGKLIILEDIKKIISFGDTDLKKTFCTVALQYHVSCNIGRLSYCHTPDCEMIYRITKEGSEFYCPSCKNSTCTHCQAPYHSGLSCEMFKECQKDVDYSLKTWVSENKTSRKYCPSCKIVIEKSDGCNHMECLNCKAHLCWLCLKIFPESDRVYSHMPYCPQNQ